MQILNNTTNKNLTIILVNPRGFCAGVTRAIDIVEKSIEKYNKPIYIRNEIVHNKTVVQDLKNKGITFVKNVEEIPQNALAIFSAHGISEKVEMDAKNRDLHFIDATCPLVKKVHSDAISYDNKGYQIILIGHNGHPEIEGTAGRIKSKSYLVENVKDVEYLNLNPNIPIAYITQTTLSLDDTSDIIKALKNKYPDIIEPVAKNICYATQNRQNAVKNIVEKIDALIVIGSQNSSNSNRLKEIGTKHNKPSFLIDEIGNIPWDTIDKINILGISAGASAPQKDVDNIIEEIGKKRNLNIINEEIIKEDVIFHLPKELRK
jgi:4-hydroxy-3-methylbut-2-enyl diphosphate reductase